MDIQDRPTAGGTGAASFDAADALANFKPGAAPKPAQDLPPMLPIIARMNGWLDLLAKLCMFVAACALAVLVSTFGWLVFGRYVLNATPTWVEQLALLLVLYIAYLGAAAGIHDNTHLGVTMFRDALPRPIAYAILLVTDVALAIFGLIMAMASFELAIFGWDTLLPMLNIPESIRTISALLCGSLVFVFAGLRAIFRVVCLVTRTPYHEKGMF